MKILVACVSSAAAPDGVTRHATSLANCLLERPGIEEVHLVMGSWQLGFAHSLLGETSPHLHLHAADSATSSNARNLWYLRTLPRLARTLHADVVHLAYPVPIRRRLFPCPVLTTLHDLYPIDAPQNFGYPRVVLNRIILSQCLAAVDAIACVSNSTLARLKTHSPQHAAKAAYIPNCVAAGPASALPSEAPHLRLHRQPFLLAVAQHRRNKNLPLTLAAFHQLTLANPHLLLAIVGNTGPETPILRKLVEHHLLRSRVLFLHGIPGHQLQWCYDHCQLLLATSSVEGFGLPIVEAMLAGSPVVCSDIPAFCEFGATYCRFVPLDSNAAPAFAQAVQQLLALPRPTSRTLRHLSAPAVADQYLRLYRTLLADHPHHLKALTLHAPKDASR